MSLNLKSVASANKISHFNNFFVLRFWLISSLILRMFYFSICTDAVMHTILTHFLCFKSFYTLLLLKILTLSLVNFCNVHGTVLLWSGGSSVQNFIVSSFIVCNRSSQKCSTVPKTIVTNYIHMHNSLYPKYTFSLFFFSNCVNILNHG